MRWMMTVLVVSTAFFARAGWAEGGVVVASDGKSYAGKVELKAGDQIAIVPPTGETVTLPFKNVARLSMAAEQAAEPAAEAGPGADASSVAPPWRHGDVGRVKAAGDAVKGDGGFVLRGAGWGIWGPEDSCHLLYQPLVGDGEVIARLANPPAEEEGSQAGLTIRAGPEPNAAQASVMFHPGGIVRLNCRPVDGRGQSAGAAAGPGAAGAPPRSWLRLIRAHDVFGAYCSADGRDWVPVGTVKVKVDERAYAGLACAAIANQELGTATFDHVSVRQEPMGPAEGFGLVDGSLIAGHVTRFDNKTLTYVDGAGVERSIPTERVAHVFTRPLPPEIRGKPLAGKPRIWLADGDLMEAQITGLSGGRVAAVSLLMGPQDLDLSRVFMVILRPVAATGSFSVHVRDGSIYRCTTVQVGESAATARSPVLGEIPLKAEDIVAITSEGPPRPASP